MLIFGDRTKTLSFLTMDVCFIFQFVVVVKLWWYTSVYTVKLLFQSTVVIIISFMLTLLQYLSCHLFQWIWLWFMLVRIKSAFTIIKADNHSLWNTTVLIHIYTVLYCCLLYVLPQHRSPFFKFFNFFKFFCLSFCHRLFLYWGICHMSHSV